jgi:hypothetical protein
VARFRRSPENEEASDHEEVGRTVKNTVPEGVELEVLDGVHRIPAAQHVMPLQHLMQNDAVEEAPEPQAQEYPGRSGKFSVFFCGVVQYLYSAQQPLTECILSKYLLIDQFDEMYFSFRLSCLNILHVSRSGQPR